MVAFENETFRLHIFEPRYKKMMAQLQQSEPLFLLGTSLDRTLQSMGALVRLVSIDERYEDGSLDISCRCQERVVLTGVSEAATIDDFDSACCEPLAFVDDENKEMNLRLLDLLSQIYELSQVGKNVPNKGGSYLDWVHKCGMELAREYEMAALTSVSERQHYALNHLKSLLHTLEQVEHMKQLVHLNGHAKRLSLL